jgi:UDP-glucose 4-epimerase
MRYLVTGGGGFIGSHLVDCLLSDRANSVVVWDSFTVGVKENLAYAAKSNRLVCCQLDTINAKEYSHAHEFPQQFDAIFHLAAESRIQPTFDSFDIVYRSNIQGTASVIQYAKEIQCKKIIFVSSCAAAEPLSSPYSLTKKQGEDMMKFAASFGISTVSARPFSVYGPRELTDGPYSTVIGIFDGLTKAGKPLTINGDGQQRRDFIHVGDLVQGLEYLSIGEYSGDVYDFGTGESYSINAVAEMFQPGKERILKAARPGEMRNATARNMPSGWSVPSRLKEYVKQLKASEAVPSDGGDK